MLIFQINPNQLEDGQKVTGQDWLFWNTYLSERIKAKDYALLPSYIDFITDTDNVAETAQSYLVELNEGEDAIDI